MIATESIKNSQEWRDCLQYISRRLSEQSFHTWFKTSKGEPNGNGEFRLAVPNQFVAEWIRGHFHGLIEEAFEQVLGHRYELVYIPLNDESLPEQSALDLSGNNGHHGQVENDRPKRERCNLNRRYDFDSLVVGDFNQFACAAAMAVAEAPGLTNYNPLYIYGGTGLGKTHIVQAIGNSILSAFPSKKVIYATSEKFTSDFIAAITDRTVSDFTRVYRDVDVLMIDDIQFLTGKESTQEQFFHTFNTLHHLGKQIVLTSDRSPKEIKGLEARLLSRFSWGLVTDLQAPDLENRMAILHKKLESEGTALPETVVRCIADIVSTNIRELEGALIRVLAYASLKQVALDVELARQVLKDNIPSQRRDISLELIKKKASEFFHVDPQMMTAKKKTSDIALARQVAMYLSRSLTDSSLKVIGAAFGGRDHSTVIHACDLITRRIASDANFREKIDRLSAMLLY
ncbi:MAG TPA: chromosomal replication initiator protein DnaA [Candidatus Deferrimicrobium sp.]|nr:chromosomal replication initiator protein DnaA [Candidatus Deferrimicrobium sp.]